MVHNGLIVSALLSPPARWMTLYISGQVSGSSDSLNVARSAGYFEGHVSAEYIHMHYLNTYLPACQESPEACTKAIDFLEANTQWITEQYNANSSYWFQVCVT